jgi:hypothetical protein
MKRRVVAFTLAWAYVACLLWLPRATDGYALWLWLFPPGYFFLVGGFFGLLHEGLAARWPRLWVTLPMGALSVELGVWLYGGHRIGLLLGLIFAAATLCASLAATLLSRKSVLLSCGAILGALLTLTWLLAPWVGEDMPDKVRVSPDGAFVAWRGVNDHGEPNIVHVEPRNSWNGAFGRIVSGIDRPNVLLENWRSIADFQWMDSRTLRVYKEGSDSLPEPSELLPIRIETALDEHPKR